MKFLSLAFAWICTAFIISACDFGPKPSRGFTLPEGNAGEGEAAFSKFLCGDCHLIAGKEDLRAVIEPRMNLPLGGRAARVNTYGELVTSIINPSHAISKKFPGIEVSEEGQSKMRNYNSVMTVNELIDLVAFLQAQYDLEPFEPTTYPPYDLRYPILPPR